MSASRVHVYNIPGGGLLVHHELRAGVVRLHPGMTVNLGQQGADVDQVVRELQDLITMLKGVAARLEAQK